MSLPAKHLKIKTSTIPQSGKGLFVTASVAKGGIITEYIGKRTTWAEVEHQADNGYIYHIDDENVIDASGDMTSFGRYANDAAGFVKVEGIKNNAAYHEEDKRVFIKATKHIPAGSEVFVSYGRQYWKQARENMKIDAREKKLAQRK